MGLIGLWFNPSIIGMKNVIKEDLSIQDHKALLMVFQLMCIQLDMALNILNSLTWSQNVWIKDVSAEELSWSLADPVGSNDRLAMIASGLWPTQPKAKDPIDFSKDYVRAGIDGLVCLVQNTSAKYHPTYTTRLM